MHDLAKAELEEEQEVGLFELQQAGIQGLLFVLSGQEVDEEESEYESESEENDDRP